MAVIYGVGLHVPKIMKVGSQSRQSYWNSSLRFSGPACTIVS